MNWESELARNTTTIEELEEILQISYSEEERLLLNQLIDTYPMSVSRYYLSLIDASDEEDPIRKMSIPSVKETDRMGSLDTSGEADNTVTAGLQHKYKQTGMILSTNQCAMYCRHCFRKRLVGLSSQEISRHMDSILSYIKEHEEINNVLISGGDSFLNSNDTIQTYLEKLSDLEHLDFIRFGTRVLVTLPMRIYEDPDLLKLLKEFNRKKRIYVMTHFNHPREMTEEALQAVQALIDCGIVVKNQTVLLRGINDEPEILAELVNRLTRWGIGPYYIFQCRPVSGVKNQFQVPLHRGYEIIEAAKARMNGLGKSFRYVMSNTRGKIEILGRIEDSKMLFKFHEAKNDSDQGRIFALEVGENQCWID